MVAKAKTVYVCQNCGAKEPKWAGKCNICGEWNSFVEEVEIEDPEEYIKKKFQGKEVSYDKTVLNDGTIIFDIVTSQIKQRCSFTEI